MKDNTVDIKKSIVIHDKIFGVHEIYSNPKVWSERVCRLYHDDNGFMAITMKNGYPNIWLTGTLVKGSFKTMMDAFTKEFSPKYSSFLISTYPSKFPRMYDIIQKNFITVHKGVLLKRYEDDKHEYMLNF